MSFSFYCSRFIVFAIKPFPETDKAYYLLESHGVGQLGELGGGGGDDLVGDAVDGGEQAPALLHSGQPRAQVLKKQ